MYYLFIGRLKVDHAQPFKAEELNKRPLSVNVSRMTYSKDRDKLILKFLHPNGTPTEEAFKDFTNGKVKVKVV